MRSMFLLNRSFQKVAVCLLLFGMLRSEAVAQVGPAPIIVVQPQSQSVKIHDAVTFEVVAVSATTMTYQWYHDGKKVGGADESTYAIRNVNDADAGLYSVLVINAAGSVMSSNAVLTVLTPPKITTQPESQTLTAGQSASFSVVASGTGPLSYQWNLNDLAIPAATDSVLTLSNVQPADAGSYTVVVANLAGSVTSAVATLTVNVPPSISTEPLSQTVTAGQSASFAVVASGTGPLS